MERFVIDGGERLYGKLEAHSAKNAVLPLLAASILTEEPVKIRNIPAINDVENMLHILQQALKRQKRSSAKKQIEEWFKAYINCC